MSYSFSFGHQFLPTNLRLIVPIRCILATFYFTQELLPRIASSGMGKARTDEAVEFVKMYGAYLSLDSSFVSAALVKADAVLEELLSLSKYDPRHREVKKELSKAGSLVLYDPVCIMTCVPHVFTLHVSKHILLFCQKSMLSAIVLHLKGIRTELKSARRHDLMNICVLAYPDLRPWQVRQACLGSAANGAEVDLEFHEMYYEYLSLLLHPWEGHDAARHDVELVTVSIKVNARLVHLSRLMRV